MDISDGSKNLNKLETISRIMIITHFNEKKRAKLQMEKKYINCN